MNKQINEKMKNFGKLFSVLIILDAIGLILMVVFLFPTFKRIAGYGWMMLCVAGVLIAMLLAIRFSEILAKIFLVRSTRPTFSWSSGFKGCSVIAKILLLFNIGLAIYFMLALGGEGSTLLNQINICMTVLASVAEVVGIIFYLLTMKHISRTE